VQHHHHYHGPSRYGERYYHRYDDRPRGAISVYF
jgi:hypothetical protein